MSLDINGVWVRTKTLKRTGRWISWYKKILDSAEQKCCTCASFYEMLLIKIRSYFVIYLILSLLYLSIKKQWSKVVARVANETFQGKIKYTIKG